MILQALDRYYERIADDPEVDIPRYGFGTQRIHFALVLNPRGELVQVRDLREVVGKKPTPASLIVPTIPQKRSVNIEPNFMWDNTGYVLGVDAKGNESRTAKCFEAFKKLHHDLCDDSDDPGIVAVLKFLNSHKPQDTSAIEHWQEMEGANLVFQLDGERRYVHDRPAVREAWTRHCSSAGFAILATCLVKGENLPIARLHPVVKGVQGAQTSGASIVSFNLDAFLSYDKKQNFNAPVSEQAAFAYAAALNHLLRFESRQKIRIGNATTIFWTERASPMEAFMGMILDPRDDRGDLSEIRQFLEAIRDGKHPTFDPDGQQMQFFILGLSPNASRLSVRFWHVSTVEDISRKIGQHFRDIAIVRGPKDHEFPGMWELLRETAVQGKAENIPPLLAGALMRSILTGAPYPQSLLSALIARIRADQTVGYARAAMIKACLNRKNSIHKLGEEVKMSLDRDSTNTAYRLGRLFAVLEKAQKEAIDPKSTIKDRYYGSASATPGVVFPQLLRMAQHYTQKADYGWRTDKMIGEIMNGIEDFPTHLSLDDQGRFAIGYYHQRQAFFVKSENQKEGE